MNHLLVQQLSSVFLFALSIFMVTVHSLLVMRVGGQIRLSPRGQVAAPFVTGAFLAVWLSVAIMLTAELNRPADQEGRLGITLLVGFAPVIAAVALLFSSKTVGALFAAMPPEWLIRVQTYRMAGLLFLYPFWYYDLIPTAFALPAAIGDFITGLLAPLVASAVSRRHPRAFTWAVAWNLFGFVDLIVAPAAAILSQAQVLNMYPLALIPCFLGPPLGILTHILSLRNLTSNRSQKTP